MADQNNDNNEQKGGMTVGEAGHMGGQKERELVEEGKRKEGEEDGEDNQNDMAKDDEDMNGGQENE